MIDQPRRQIAMRGGLALIDRLAIDRFGKRFVSCADRERRLLLDEIAYTSNPDRGLSQAIAFFSSFRDLTASGFWSTKMGVADLQYQGNVFVSEWNRMSRCRAEEAGRCYLTTKTRRTRRTHEEETCLYKPFFFVRLRALRVFVVNAGSGHALRILPDRQRQRDCAEDRQDQQRLRDVGETGALHQDRARDRHEMPHGIQL